MIQPEYTLHKIAISEWNDAPYFAMRSGDGEAFNLYDEEDMRAVYDMLHAYFTNGTISEEPVEIEEIEGHWKQTWQAVKLAREYGVPAGRTDEQIANTIRKAAADKRIKGAHQTLDGSEWWYSLRGLEDYLSRMTWRDRRKPATNDTKRVYFEDMPCGNERMVSDVLAEGRAISHEADGIFYTLYLDEDDKIFGVIDTEYYRLMDLPLPGSPVLPKEIIVKPADRKAANAILKKHGYRWEKFDQDWLDDNDDFDRVPGWYLFHGTGKAAREIGDGDNAVDQAFDEINRGVDVVREELRQQAIAAQKRYDAAQERKRELAAMANEIINYGEVPQDCEFPAGDVLFDTRNIYGAGSCFVIAPDHIWYIRSNGMDGDDWSHNNLPGSIAWRVPFADELEKRLRSLV